MHRESVTLPALIHIPAAKPVLRWAQRNRRLRSCSR
jgi:hypothetical protein